MIYGAILAGGVGRRMGYIQLPKQFLPLGNKPIIIHTIEKFLACENLDYVLVGVNSDWLPHCEDIVARFIGNDSRLILTEGGQDRNSTIINIIDEIRRRFGICSDDIIVTHDAVRPFVTHRIIEENIEAAKKHGVCDTVIMASDTIVRSEDGELISEIPERRFMFQGQTPQSFNIQKLLDLYSALSDEQKKILTDACKIFVLRGQKVKIVEGDVSNFKITTMFDYKLAQAIVTGDEK